MKGKNEGRKQSKKGNCVSYSAKDVHSKCNLMIVIRIQGNITTCGYLNHVMLIILVQVEVKMEGM